MNVVCIDDRPPSWGWGELKPLVRGMVYTVEAVCPQKHDDVPPTGGFLLVGHIAPYSRRVVNGVDCAICNCYRESRFRPVRETSIEQLKLICEPVA